MTLTEFRAKCLAVFDDVEQTRRQVSVTKRGKPYVIVEPVTVEDEQDLEVDTESGEGSR